ncbi:MAG: NUDIX domain-containing protein [Candidatus Liptonbacteria bacterium]|nr:NUDIX domain-containing protein [Candidatus Liptonbacteria bacterium]
MTTDIQKDVVYFARTDFRNTNRLFGIKRKDRRQHMYVVGKTGTGKTALLNNTIIQDIANGEGVCVIDPHGELVEGLLDKIPAEREKDVIYFNPADPDHHIGFNILELPDPRYKHLVASGLMGIFTKIWAGVWSARMEYIMNNAVLALLENPGSTLLGINRILVDKDFRQKIISNVKDPVIRAFWVNEYEQWKDQFRNEAIAPIQNKVGQFLSTAMIRNIVGQEKSTIDIFEIMNGRKILLVNVSKGRVGEDNSALLGAMLITKVQLAAMERVRVPEEERKDFYLYVDEFQNFATDSFAGILSEARKYRLNLIVAHQYIGQLITSASDKVSTKVRDAVFGNVGTMIVFRIGAADAEFLESEFEPEFVIQDMVNLPNYCVYLKLMVDGITCRPFSAKTLAPFRVMGSQEIAEHIVEMSRKLYAKPREFVEEQISRWSGMFGEQTAPSANLKLYPAICSSCGKSAEVPFEPAKGRPVYCSECLSKIQAGKLEPVSGKGKAAKKADEEFARDLADLGIEFEFKKPPAKRLEEIPKSAIRKRISLSSLAQSERRKLRGAAVAVLITTPEGIPLIKDPKKPPPNYWKLPGGRSAGEETAEEAAIREIEEEIGVSLKADDLEVIYENDKGNHILMFFEARLPKLPLLKKEGGKGEEVGVFSPEQILSLPDFFPNHLNIVKDYLSAAGDIKPSMAGTSTKLGASRAEPSGQEEHRVKADIDELRQAISESLKKAAEGK